MYMIHNPFGQDPWSFTAQKFPGHGDPTDEEVQENRILEDDLAEESERHVEKFRDTEKLQQSRTEYVNKKESSD